MKLLISFLQIISVIEKFSVELCLIDKCSIEKYCNRKIFYRKLVLSINFLQTNEVIDKFAIENKCYRKIFCRKWSFLKNFLQRLVHTYIHNWSLCMYSVRIIDLVSVENRCYRIIFYGKFFLNLNKIFSFLQKIILDHIFSIENYCYGVIFYTKLLLQKNCLQIKVLQNNSIQKIVVIEIFV